MPLPWHTPCGRPADVHKSVWNRFGQSNVARLALQGQSTGRTLQIRSWRICGVRVKMLKNKPAAAIGDRIFTLTPEMARVK